MERQAFVLRIAPSGIDRVPEALDRNQLIIGWAEAEGLLDDRLSWEEFRTVISDTYYSDEETLRKAGAAAGHMWRFIREMAEGDLVVVPHGSGFHVARVSGSALYDQSRVDEDTAYRRGVDWLNKKQAIPRAMARSALVARMKIQGTSARASDVFAEIEECTRLLHKSWHVVVTQAPAFSVARAWRSSPSSLSLLFIDRIALPAGRMMRPAR